MLLEIMDTLKELGRFDNSLIIVHADHGYWRAADSSYEGDPLCDFVQMDTATSEEIEKCDVCGYSGTIIEAKYQALLLIKLPGVGESAGDLTVNDALAQLLDLREYINRVIDDEDGACEYPERERVDIHHGLIVQLLGDEKVVVGQDIQSGHINHYVVRPGGKWEIRDNIPFEYE
jgi:hypothetical protein